MIGIISSLTTKNEVITNNSGYKEYSFLPIIKKSNSNKTRLEKAYIIDFKKWMFSNPNVSAILKQIQKTYRAINVLCIMSLFSFVFNNQNIDVNKMIVFCSQGLLKNRDYSHLANFRRFFGLVQLELLAVLQTVSHMLHRSGNHFGMNQNNSNRHHNLSYLLEKLHQQMQNCRKQKGTSGASVLTWWSPILTLIHNNAKFNFCGEKYLIVVNDYK